MNILLGHPNRDLLSCCRTLLTQAGHQVVTVFDGTQAAARFAAGGWDLAILGSRMPRIDTRRLVQYLNEQNVPVIVLLDGAVSTGMLLDSVLANGYLEMPFAPRALTETVEQVARTAGCGQPVTVGPLALVPSDFRLNGQTRLTARELEVLTALARQDRVTGEKTAAYVSALNNKFIRCKVPLGIRYEQNRGYRLVTEHE